MVGAGGRDFYLLLPQVLLEGGASIDGCGVAGLDLLAVGRLLEQARAKGGELSKTMLPTGGRSLSKGTMSEQATEESSPFLADVDLAKPFLLGTEMFITFTFFSQPMG